MPKKKNADILDSLHLDDLRKRVAKAMGGSSSTRGRKVAKDLRSAAAVIEDRIKGDKKRTQAAKKGGAKSKAKAKAKA
jgi:hypothetical protein